MNPSRTCPASLSSKGPSFKPELAPIFCAAIRCLRKTVKRSASVPPTIPGTATCHGWEISIAGIVFPLGRVAHAVREKENVKRRPSCSCCFSLLRVDYGNKNKPSCCGCSAEKNTAVWYDDIKAGGRFFRGTRHIKYLVAQPGCWRRPCQQINLISSIPDPDDLQRTTPGIITNNTDHS